MNASELLQRHQFALVDRAHLIPQEWHEELPLMPLVHEELEASPDRLPALLPLKPDASYMKALALNLELAKEEPDMCSPCALLATAPGTKPTRLQKQLTSCLVVPVLPRNSKAYIRYFDPTVFPKLSRIIAPSRWSLLYGSVLEWVIPFQKEWISFPAPEPEHRVALWSITEQEWDRIARIRLVNEALTEYGMALDHPWASFVEYDEASMLAERAILEAHKHYGIEDWDDLLAYALHALWYGEHFHRHPRIQGLLRRLPPEGYGAAAAKISETVWAEAKTLTCND